MFEGTLVESRGLAGTGTARWTALGSILLQCALACVVIAIPTLRTQAMPMLTNVPKMMVPVLTRPPVTIVKVMQASESMSAAASAPRVTAAAETAAPRFSQSFSHSGDVGPAPVVDSGLRMGGGESINGPLAALGSGPSVAVVRAKPAGTVRISSGVSAGMLMSRIQPVYPAIARAARIEGVVVMEATISKAGRIESLRAVSGPEMLRGAALEAVQAAKYQPYKLNGEVTEVQTTITVVFRLGS